MMYASQLLNTHLHVHAQKHKKKSTDTPIIIGTTLSNGEDIAVQQRAEDVIAVNGQFSAIQRELRPEFRGVIDDGAHPTLPQRALRGLLDSGPKSCRNILKKGLVPKPEA